MPYSPPPLAKQDGYEIIKVVSPAFFHYVKSAQARKERLIAKKQLLKAKKARPHTKMKWIRVPAYRLTSSPR